MKTKYLLLLVASLALFCVMACNKNNDTDHTCIVVYTIDSHEGRTTVKNDMEWDQLLNRFCDYAHEGKSVTFYNLSSHPSDLYASKGTTQNNEPTTYTTRGDEGMDAPYGTVGQDRQRHLRPNNRHLERQGIRYRQHRIGHKQLLLRGNNHCITDRAGDITVIRRVGAGTAD